MTRKRKTPDHLVKLVEDHARQLIWIDEVLRVKATVPVEDQGSHVRKSVEYWHARAEGMSNMLETALMNWNCYGGFGYRGEAKSQLSDDGKLYTVRDWVGPQHAEFQEWRREYFTRGA